MKLFPAPAPRTVYVAHVLEIHSVWAKHTLLLALHRAAQIGTKSKHALHLQTVFVKIVQVKIIVMDSRRQLAPTRVPLATTRQPLAPTPAIEYVIHAHRVPTALGEPKCRHVGHPVALTRSNKQHAPRLPIEYVLAVRPTTTAMD